MKVLIIEDEIPAARQLQKLLREQNQQIEVLDILDSVEGAVNWLHKSAAKVQLIFMDIQLADGLSFDIFQQVTINSPVIFTTAFDHYTMKAFKVNSIDYLLKPIDPQELTGALEKYQQFFMQPNGYTINYQEVLAAIQSQQQPTYKKRFLVKSGQELRFINTDDIQYLFSEDSLVFAQVAQKQKFHLDYSLDQIEKLVNPALFFRINRKLIVQLNAIHKIHTYFNSRLLLDLSPQTEFDAIVSRDRVPDFKQWLDQ
ncbi:MAG TPA: LytTR family DNA-binding domain-containing protein [Saprospiraceae bacterium]|nr:LytTR family DNA-binding domain-containing protein [Saprospiraceae bacterium]